MLLSSSNLGAFDDSSIVEVSESDPDGYDGSIEADRVGNAVWAELRLMYGLQIAKQAAECHAHRSSSEMTIAVS